MRQLVFQEEVFKEMADSKTLEELEWKVSEMKNIIEFGEKKVREKLAKKEDGTVDIYNKNGLKFIPLKWVKCINYRDQNNDEYDLIKVGDIYPVICENALNNGINYLIVNIKGRKQYWDSKDFEEINT